MYTAKTPISCTQIGLGCFFFSYSHDITSCSVFKMVECMTECHAPEANNYLVRRPPMSMRFPCFTLLGLRLHAMTKQDLLSLVISAVSEQTGCVIANHNMHSLYLYSREPRMQTFYSAADYVQIDGMPLVWLGRLLALPLKAEHRTTNLDLLPLLLEEAERRQWKIFYLGSRPGVAEKGARILQSTYPRLQIATRDGYFNMTRSGVDNQRVLSEIRDYAPDVLMVGMGMPRQEIWIDENAKDLPVAAFLCCGGLMDLVAREIPTPPRWLGSIGLEWLFRLVSQPLRTWRRYLLEPWVIVCRIIANYRRFGCCSLAVNMTAGSDADGREALKS